MTTPADRIDVKTYLSIHLFLQDYYAEKKRRQKGFSYQSWADELQMSKTYIRFAVAGKRKISETLAQRLCDEMALAETDREYFQLLLLFCQSQDAGQKKILGRKLNQLLRVQLAITDITPGDDIMMDPLYLTVRNVLSFSDIPRTTEFLAKLFSLEIPEMERILLLLERQELVGKSGSIWSAKHDSVRVATQPKNQAIRRYHRLSLLKAIEAQELENGKRSFRSMSVAMDGDQYREYLQDVVDFFHKTFTKFNASTLQSKKVYQINFNVFPWTQEVPMEEVSESSREMEA